MKRKTIACSFCESKIIKVTESTIESKGKIIKSLRVRDGYFLINNFTTRLPICSVCWAGMSEYKPDPLRVLLVRSKK